MLRHRSWTSFTQTIPKHLCEVVKIYKEIMMTSTPRRSETNGVAERVVRRVQEGIANALVQKRTTKRMVGLVRRNAIVSCATCTTRWHDSMTAFEKRYGQTFDGPSIPNGSLVEHIPMTAKDKARVHHL